MTRADSPRVFDGHTDTLLDLHLDERGGGRSLFERSTDGHVDLPRARDANYAGGCFAIFVPNRDHETELVETHDGYAIPLAPPVDHEYAKAFTFDVLADLHRYERESSDRDDGAPAFRVARTAADVRTALESTDDVVALARARQHLP